MTREEFSKTTDRLQELYKSKLNDTQLDFWYDELKNYEAEKYRRAIGEYVKSNKKMPTISDLLEKLKHLKPIKEATTEEVKQVHCDTCKERGLVKYYKKIGDVNYEYLCRCYCENGKKHLGLPIKDYKDIFFYRKPSPMIEEDISQIQF